MIAFGCDPGCGFAMAALLTDEAKDPVAMLPKSLPGGMPTTAFAQRNGEIRVWNTQQDLRRHPGQAIHAVKSRLPEGAVTLYDKKGPFQVESDDAYAAVVRDLFALVEREMESQGRQPVRDVVLTYPAGFADMPVEEGERSLLARMKACAQRVKLWGEPLRVVAMLPEPAAAALDYLYYMQHQAEESRRLGEDHCTVLVYDLGHGTFDTALVTARSAGEPYQLLEKSGLPDVGGQDFDRLLARQILRSLQEAYGWSPAGEQQAEEVRRLAVEAKHSLSDSDTYTGVLFPEGDSLEFTLTRAQFEELAAPLLARTLECAQSMLRWAQAQGAGVDRIVLAGGGSRMPMVKRALEELTGGKLPVELHRPELAVAFGAARYAQGLADSASHPRVDPGPGEELPRPNTVLEQVTSRGYGIRVPSQLLEGEVRILIPPGVRLPYTSEAIPLRTAGGSLKLRVACTREGGHTGPVAAVEDCRELIRLAFDLPPDTAFQCTLHMDENGGLTATCALPDGTRQSSGTYTAPGC